MQKSIIVEKINKDKKINDITLVTRLKRGEEQIKKGEVTDADIVFKQMKEKYSY